MPPQIGDKVFIDGRYFDVIDPTRLAGPDVAARLAAVGTLVCEDAVLRIHANAADFDEDHEIGWYLRGRLLCKCMDRGSLKPHLRENDERVMIAELMDRGLIPSKSALRRPGSAPMAEEHLELCKAFCHGPSKRGLLKEMLDKARRGEPHTGAEQATLAAYRQKVGR